METRELTNSMRTKWSACHRAYKIAYVDRIRPVKTSDALAFGTAMHALLETYWTPGDRAPADEILARVEDAYVRQTLGALFDAYIAKWGEQDAQDFDRVAAEVRFDAPLMNPETGGESRTWHLAGKIDAIARRKAYDQAIIVEHKTTSQDIGPGSDYWRKLPIDGQVSGYYVGAQCAGYDVRECLYDVVRKPALKPYKATPADKLKYNKDGSLSKLCRLEDETPEEYGARIREDIASRPDYYFARVSVARSENDLAEYLYDMWSTGREIADAEKMQRFSRNPASCSIFGSCEYFDVCTGCASLNDPTLFQTIETANPELAN